MITKRDDYYCATQVGGIDDREQGKYRLQHEVTRELSKSILLRGSDPHIEMMEHDGELYVFLFYSRDRIDKGKLSLWFSDVKEFDKESWAMR